MAFVRYQSPDESTFTVFDISRFQVEHGLFLLRLVPLRNAIEAMLEKQRDWNLPAMKLVEENRRLASCLEWLQSLDDDSDVVVLPDLKHEPAIDLVADRLIVDHDYFKMFCPACEIEYRPEQVTLEPWAFEEDGVIVRGRRSTCPNGHTIHVMTDEIDAIDLEVDS
jgi:hypothetical protein